MTEASKRVAALSADRLRALAAKLKEKDRAAGDEPIRPRAASAGPLPLSFSQERLWFLDQLGEGTSPYNVPAALRLTGPLDVRALSRTWTELVRRHESLRTTFVAEDGRPLQAVAPPPDRVALPLADVPDPAEGERLAAEEARRPFDLVRGPLLRLALLRLSAEDHVLLVTMHHIVSDGWSMTVLIREMTALYEAFREDRPSPLPEPPIQYADFALWQRERLSGEKLDAELAWWRGRLTGLEPLELPTDRPRPPVPSHRGGHLRQALSSGASERLRELGRAHGATPFMVLLALCQTLLSRYSGQTDLAAGSPVANRGRSEVEGLVGFFVNTLVLRTDLSGDPGFRELLGRVRETTLAAYAHDELPFEKLVEHLEVERSTDRNPLFQVLCALQNQPWPEMRMGGVRLTPLPVESGVAKLDLSLLWSEEDGRFLGMLEWSADLFEEATAERLLSHHEALIAAVLEVPERRIGELAILSAAQRRQLIAEGTRVPRPEGLLVHELVEAQVTRTPKAPAVVADEVTLTYQDLEERSNRLARHLAAMGVGPDARVGLSVERSAEMVVGLLGVLKAGGAYLPLDPDYPAERVAAMIEDARPTVVLDRERIAELSSSGSGEPLHLPVPDNALAYLLFTSGSTGRPKGVMIEHRSLVNNLLWLQEAFPFRPSDRLLQRAPFGFDASIWEFWSPLMVGGTVVMARPGEHRDPAALVRAAHAQRITILQSVPSMLGDLLDEGLGDCRGLRRVFLGGEALTADVRDRFFRAMDAELVDLYGPTEATIDVTARRLKPEQPLRLGSAIHNTRLLVLDRNLGLSPLGVPGEICIGGVPVGRGYFERPAETAERCGPDPFADIPGARLYRTGDLGRWRPDGLEFLGRIDHLVKIRGVRIELGEIEATLARHPGVDQAVVLVREGARLAAYVAGVAEPAALRAFLRETLPEAMVPLDWVSLPELPRTPNGKIDRKALALLEPAVSAEDGFVAPRTPAEELLAGIFEEVLGIARVGARDDFFALGGHSLLATRVAARVRAAFGVSLPLRKLFEATTVEALAAEVGGGGPGLAIPRLPHPPGATLPLSFSQERLWVLDRLEPGAPTYNMPGVVEIRGALRGDALAASLAEVVRRHESLRTIFPTVDGAPRQKILPALEIPLPVIDVPEEEAGRIAAEHARRSFDLARGPLIDALLLRLGPDRHRFLAVFHHVVCDGWSVGVFVREIAALYDAFSQGRPSPLPELPVQYADFAVWQREAVEETREADLAWWRERLEGEIAPLELPADRPRPAVQTFRGGHRELVLTSTATGRLRAFARERGATLFMVLLAAAKALLGRQSGQEDVLVGTPVAGRRTVETERLIGIFLNTLVLRTDLSGSPGFAELVARVREVTLGAFSHQDVPFEALLAELPQQRDLSRTPLFQVMFNLLNLPPAELRLPGLTLEAVALPALPSKFDMTFYVAEAGETLRIELVYNADLFDAARMEELLAQYELFLEQALARPEAPVGSLSLVTERARGLLPDPKAPLPPVWEDAAHEMFAERARRHPERTAVSGAWTYGELDVESRRLAGWLAAQGVRKGDRVAIYAHRSAPLALAVLGTLRAGAAFTILDSAYPAARLAEIFRIAAPKALLRMEAAGSLPESLEGCPRLDLPAALPDLPAPDVVTGPDDLAYVAFTSGSTGTPKAVAGPHRPLSHFLAWHRERFGLGESDRFSLLSGLAHDPLLRDLLTPLTAGATLCIPDPEALAAGRLARWMRGEEITVAHLTPAMSEILTETRGEELPALRYAFFGGDVLTRRSLERLRRLAPGCTVVSYYGATETPQGMGYHVVQEPERERIPLGRGIDGVQLLVRNPAGELAGVGELGEIAIRTPYLAAGYLNDPELTRERFVADLYGTGDLGRYLPNGEVDFHGRADLQVKIRGYRIEPGEIEAVLASLPGVREAVVVAREERLVAYVVPGREVTAAALREGIRERLPQPMVPSAFVILERLPLTPNGKVDRRALPEPAESPETTAVAPRTPLEEALAALWREVLGRETVGVHDDFFALGGHSLLATRLVFRIEEALGREIGLRSLFEAPTVADLAVLLESRESGGAASFEPLRPVPADRHLPFPLTDIQQAYWVGRTGELELGHVTSHRYVELEGEGLDLARLERAWQRLIDRHDMLRAVFLPDGRQKVLPEVPPYRIEVEDLRRESPEAVSARLAERRERMSHQSLAIDRWPLFEIRAGLLPGGRVRLFFSFDYLIADAWSFGLLTRELLKAYAEPDAPLGDPLELSFRDYVLAGIARRDTETFRRSREYWQRRLETLPPGPELPLAQSLGALREQTFVRRSARLEPPAWSRLKERALCSGVTPSGLLLAAFSEVLGTWSKTSRFTIVLTLFNRLPLHPDVEKLVGDFTSTILLEVERSPGESFERRAQAVQRQLWSDLDHRHVSGVEVLRETARSQGALARPASPVVFTSTLGLEAAREGPPAPALPVEPVYAISQTPQVLLDHQVSERGGALVFNWDAVQALFPAGMLDGLFAAYRELLERLADPDVWTGPVTASIPAAQLARREEVNATAAPVPRGLLHEPFLAQAARHPERAAVIAPGRTLTYGELLARADRLGRSLREEDARPNTLVAVVMEKGWEQVVAVLGVLLSGAAYLPVDPALPPERLRYLLEHGEVGLALTQPRFVDALAWPAEVRVLPVADDDAPLPEAPLEAVQTPDDLAYVIFTSGSTGLPKGVMIDHRAALNTVADVNGRFRVGPDDRVLALSALSFDLSVYDLFGLLAAGGAIVFPEPAALREPARWAGYLRVHGVTLWNTVPALMEMLVHDLEGRSEPMPPSLRLALLSGDWIPVDLPGRLRALAPAIEIISLGGATEASIWSILFPIDRVDPDWKSIPYGRPMANQTFHVLDEALAPRPDWVPGQLHIGGTGLARGYWRDPEKTAAGFLVHPRTGERLYRTGDLGRFLPDGTLEFLGREDFQVKVQGYRIELGEIEAALAQHPAVRAAVVDAPGERGDRSLAAWVVPAPGETVDAPALQGFLREKLPAYMVPSVFVFLPGLPLTGNGKVDRRALPAPGALPPEERREPSYVAPRMPAEETLASIFAEVLEVEKVGVEDHFFAHGGNSLKAILLISRVRQAFDVELPLERLFANPTIAGMARAILEAQGNRVEDDEMARLLAELDEMSDEDARELLGQEMEEAAPAPEPEAPPARPQPARRRPISFSLFYFASEESGRGDRWRLLFEGAKFADRHGFEAVWTPERHFHPFGGLFPNPAVAGAALAMVTERVHLRAGSGVLPLHHPVRVAEDWALVDNYSRGRAGIAFASGWHADDFVFFPGHYEDRREVMFQGIDTIRRLWRGEAVAAPGGVGQEVRVRLYPRPVQPELPVWITAAATSNTVLRAGEIGANLLVNLLGQSLEGVAAKIRQYREARAAAGHDPGTGRVTLMLHTFVGDDPDAVLETVRAPFTHYLRSFGGLLENLARSRQRPGEIRTITEEDKEQVLAYAVERYVRDSALFGTPGTCIEMVRHLEEIGVDEVACLIDFGIDVETALAGLERLALLKELAERSAAPPGLAVTSART
ncbi:MAG TPA: amino acid adenylation domain-containing protein [Thermoanaerobaculia bacterium]|nr:amino acid adenylation domain-containing protein [Thermoanaerobaculia bacterium]